MTSKQIFLAGQVLNRRMQLPPEPDTVICPPGAGVGVVQFGHVKLSVKEGPQCPPDTLFVVKKARER